MPTREKAQALRNVGGGSEISKGSTGRRELRAASSLMSMSALGRVEPCDLSGYNNKHSLPSGPGRARSGRCAGRLRPPELGHSPTEILVRTTSRNLRYCMVPTGNTS